MTPGERTAPSDAAIEAAANAIPNSAFDAPVVGAGAARRQRVANLALAAALPLLRAQWAAEVDAALRDDDAYLAWARAKRFRDGVATPEAVRAADYLADTLGAKPEGTDRG